MDTDSEENDEGEFVKTLRKKNERKNAERLPNTSQIKTNPRTQLFNQSNIIPSKEHQRDQPGQKKTTSYKYIQSRSQRHLETH